MISVGTVSNLRGRSIQYERNGGSWPLVYRLSEKAAPGSYAIGDKR